MLTTRNLWVLLIGTALLVLAFWFGSYHRNYQPELPAQLGAIPDLQLVVAENQPFDQRFFDGHVTAVSFATIACPESCLDGLFQLNKLKKLMRNDERFQTFTIGVGFRGQFPALESLISRVGVNGEGWRYAVEQDNGDAIGRINQVLANYPLKHVKLNTVAVIDSRGQLRGVYDVSDKFAVVQLQNDIYNLLLSPHEAFSISQKESGQ
jgi:hypothetical protein